jgi:hypothetical protein
MDYGGKMAAEMVIMARMFELLEWVIPKVAHFPRVHRFTLSARITHLVLDLQENLIAAQSARGPLRRKLLQRADGQLQALRVYFRLVHRWRWLNDGQYEHVSRLITEVGRLLGGWLRSSQGPA